ncbi:MAG: PLP-dependent transferase [Firmicutes bacterium]|nr:PLP-dependent transferase [Alicyclobacillaceae bacterium]MCL6498172.1 PLP-dependent transferase [Bacillota bacterium]
MRPTTRAVLVESFTNPYLYVPKMPRMAEEAERHHLALIVDNTPATPYLQRPVTLGVTEWSNRPPNSGPDMVTTPPGSPPAHH